MPACSCHAGRRAPSRASGESWRSTSSPLGSRATRFSFLELDDRGVYVVRSGEDHTELRAVPVRELASHFRERVSLPAGVTDVFVWVHGWRNDYEQALDGAIRLFSGIESAWSRERARYAHMSSFGPGFVAVHWPSMSDPGPQGYSTIRDRAHAMTEGGAAHLLLASLLGYLDADRKAAVPAAPGTLRAAGGYHVHCVGHSFGGRFLGQAIAAAAEASPDTLEMLARFLDQPETLSVSRRTGTFTFTVDSLVVFQMAAPSEIFSNRFRALLVDAPLSGPICLTHSSHDTATCFWHRKIEGRPGIGCRGASAPASEIRATSLRRRDEEYGTDLFLSHPIVNVDCTWAFDRTVPFSVTGAHSDYWYEESVHLLLSMVNAVRVRRGTVAS